MFIWRWVGPTINVDTNMLYKILHPNGGYIVCSTVCVWAPLEEANASLLAEWASFVTQLKDLIDPAAGLEDFPY